MTCDNDRCYGGNRLGFSWKGGATQNMAPSTMVIRSKIVAGMRRSGEARARPSDDGCVQPRRRPHTEVRRVSTAVTTLCRGARNTANHQTGRYPPYQWFNRKEQDAHTDSERSSSPAAYSVVSALPSRTTTQCGTRHCTINVLTLEEDEGGWATSMATKRSRIW